MALDTIPKQEGGKLKAVASGTLPSGQPVVVNADGTVSVVEETSFSEVIGSETVFESDSTLGTSCGFDSNSNKVVIAYRDFGNSNYGTAVVGTVSGTSISFGTPVVFNSTGTTDENNVVFDSLNNKIVIVYQDGGNSGYGTAIVGTVSGDTISFGSPTVFFSQSSLSHPSATFDTVNNKVVISYADENDYGAAIVGTVSGTSISFGSSTVFESANTDNTAITFDSSNNKVVVAYQDAGNSNYGTAVVGTVSGTSISFGTPVIFESQDSDEIAITFDSASNKVVVVYQDDGGNNSRYGTAIVGTVSGTSISFGSPSIFESANTDSITASFDSNVNKVVIQYRDGGNSDYGTIVFGTVNGNAITFTSPTVFNTANTGANSSVFDSNSNKVIVAYQDAGNSAYGTAIVVQAAGSATNLTTENYIGMSSGPASPSGFGTAAIFETGATDDIGSAYDSTNNRHVIAYQDEGNSNYGTAVVATVSGSTVSFGSPVVFETGTTKYVSPVFDSTNNKVVIFYQDDSNSGYLTAIVGTVSGNSISFGTAVVVESNDSSFISAAFDSANGKVVCHWYDQTNAYGIVGTVSGTTISFGTRVQVNAGTSQYTDTVYDSNAGKVVVTYRAPSTNNGAARVGTVSGTSISYGSEVAFNSGNTEWRCSVFDPTTNKIAILYKDAADSDKGKIVVGTVSGTSISFGSEVEVTTGNMFTTNGAIAVNPSGKLVMVYRDLGNSSYGTLRTGTISGTTVTLDTAQVYSEVNSQHNVITYNSTEDRMLIAYSDVGGNDQGIGQVYAVGFGGEVASGGAATVDIIGSISTNQGGLTAGQQYFVQTDGTLSETPADPSVLAGTALSATKMTVKS